MINTDASKVKVIILAAGKGTRVREIFPDIPKPLILIDEKPIIERIIEQYNNFDILLNVRKEDADKFKYLDLPLLIENTPLGNAGAVKYFIKELGERFIATHTDIYSDLDPKDLINAHKHPATMVVKDVAKPKEFGMITHEEDLVTGFTRERLINCGIYMFSKDIVNYIGDGFQDFDKDLFPKLINDKKMKFYQHVGLWHDIGRKEFWNKETKK